MYKVQKDKKTGITVNKSYEGETIEQKVNRITNNKEPISDGAPLIYTDRKDGTQPAYDIRTDRFEIAVDAMDKVTKSHIAKRNRIIGEQAEKGKKAEENTNNTVTTTTETKPNGGPESPCTLR